MRPFIGAAVTVPTAVFLTESLELVRRIWETQPYSDGVLLNTDRWLR